jgi:hypothetical protein
MAARAARASNAPRKAETWAARRQIYLPEGLLEAHHQGESERTLVRPNFDRSASIAAKFNGQRSWFSKCRKEDYPMPLIRNGYVESTRRGFLGGLGSTLLALVLFGRGAAIAQTKQIKLTEKQIQGFITVFNDMTKLYENADPNKLDPKLDAQAEALAKKNGFVSLGQYDDVSANISMIFFGVDPQTKKFTEPPDRVREEIEALRADKSMPDAEKKKALPLLEASLKTAKPIQFKENITVVLKYFEQLSLLLQS